ncbi:MAG: type II secretion system GspH family protein [Chloroflexi bacterium]|nr:type II secretion system GspH family protein [Chloroflexota bacterium]
MFKRGGYGAFTLTELLIAMALLVIFNISILQLMRGGIRVYRKAKILSELDRSANNAFDAITSDYKYCSSQLTPLPDDIDPSETFQFIRYVPNATPGGAPTTATVEYYTIRETIDTPDGTRDGTYQLYRRYTPEGGEESTYIVADSLLGPPVFQRDPIDSSCYDIHISFLYDPLGDGEETVTTVNPGVWDYGPWRRLYAAARISAGCDTAQRYPTFANTDNTSDVATDGSGSHVQGYVQISESALVDLPRFRPLMKLDF